MMQAESWTLQPGGRVRNINVFAPYRDRIVSGIRLARPMKIVIDSVVGTVKAETRSNKTGIAVYRGIGVPQPLNKFGWEVKKRLMDVDSVERQARENGVEFVDLYENREGRIGALAAIALGALFLSLLPGRRRRRWP